MKVTMSDIAVALAHLRREPYSATALDNLHSLVVRYGQQNAGRFHRRKDKGQ